MKRVGRAALAALVVLASGCGGGGEHEGTAVPQASEARGGSLVSQGRQIFRYETFGDEAKWTGQLRMHEAIPAVVDPTTALSVGLKVDVHALPGSLKRGIRTGTVDLKDPLTTLALIELDAVVGLRGRVEVENGVRTLKRIGVTCALCHSTVDDSFAAGIGRRLDGWPNRDLDVGGIIALSPALTDAQKGIFRSWGAGKYDPRFNVDGQSKPVVIPPAYGLRGIHRITFTGDGDSIAYWNRYVAVTQMGGLGSFSDRRLPLSITNGTVDLVSDKLPALQAYQLSLSAPRAPRGSFDKVAAQRGKLLFERKAQCVSCHSGALFTDANQTLHPPADSMAEPEVPSYASRSATRQYRTTPLRGVWQHAPYFHDGSAATLEDVAATYDRRRGLGLTAQEVSDLAQYLRSL